MTIIIIEKKNPVRSVSNRVFLRLAAIKLICSGPLQREILELFSLAFRDRRAS
jgi:hypothetical protein